MIAHNWQRGDSLSQLAVDHGFADWRRIWDHAANAGLRGLRGTPDNIQVGDVVNIPDRVAGEDTAPTENETRFIRLGEPVGSVHIVDDGGRPRTEFARALDVLEVSNLVTTSQLPAGHLQASTDRDNFKIEVVDTGERGNRIPPDRTVVEILRPALNPDGTFQTDAAGNTVFVPFAPPRRITGGVDLRRVPGTNKFRSRYFRLVSDQEDFRVRDGRTLLADHDPADLRVEILDQLVRVTYTTSGGEPLRAEARVGRDELRFRLSVNVLRRAPGGALVNGLTLDEVRRHVLKWVRRTYAQCSMAPKLVDFFPLPAGTPAGATRTDPALVGVREIDPPENLVTLLNRNRNTARANERIRFRAQAGPRDVRVDFTTPAAAGARTPREIADECAAQLRAGGFEVDVADNARATNFSRSCDLLIRDPDGNRVTISEERVTPAGARTRILVGRVRPDRLAVPSQGFNWDQGTSHVRALVRNYRKVTPFGAGEDRIDAFVAGRFDTTDLGVAWSRSAARSAIFRPVHPLRGTVCVVGRFMHAAVGEAAAAPEQQVHVLDHECGHVLLDMVHFNGFNVQLMTNAGAAPAQRNNVFESKRMADRVLTYREGFGEQANATETGLTRRSFQDNLNPTQRARTRELAVYLEAF